MIKGPTMNAPIHSGVRARIRAAYRERRGTPRNEPVAALATWPRRGKPAEGARSREDAVAAREEAAALREEAMRVREQALALREEVVRALDEDAHGKPSLEQLVAQVREVNGRLIVVSVRAQALVEEAEQANRLKDEFLATVSHELRTPLNAVLGWARLMGSKPLPPDRWAHALAAIERSAMAQAHMIDDLLDVTRIVKGTLRLAPEPLDLAAVVQAALDDVRPLAASKNVQLAFTESPGRRSVSGDPGRLQQVVWNLLANAIKFTPKGGHVSVFITPSNGHVEVSVVDTGQGISPDFLPHVFERFRQADDATTRRHTGLGLGLAIVQQLVELHGGTVHAASEGVGRGATFTVRLPLSAGTD